MRRACSLYLVPGLPRVRTRPLRGGRGCPTGLLPHLPICRLTDPPEPSIFPSDLLPILFSRVQQQCDLCMFGSSGLNSSPDGGRRYPQLLRDGSKRNKRIGENNEHKSQRYRIFPIQLHKQTAHPHKGKIFIMEFFDYLGSDFIVGKGNFVFVVMCLIRFSTASMAVSVMANLAKFLNLDQHPGKHPIPSFDGLDGELIVILPIA